ncbi:hypothetical protein M4I32_11695 [Microbacterium sp. LRZ72]|uniref:arsenate reductase/protein-tyrosine-phosphatase family protein n=1 Tax=Microbacterium sp. LRZ72 TaxID=2942481 RepID=UPI0029B36829|nr:hypothetical protein [Microbacterium sp. LRZ72]MDX2377463.1 hypothetical protein [Microbacterium sp. LRZ72]
MCTANVCRSVLAQLTLENALQSQEDADALRVTSAGVHAATSADACARVERRHADEAWRDAAAAHRPTRVTPFKVTQAQLILTASRSSRIAVAKLVPEARARVFTLSEAVLLGEGYERDPSLREADTVAAFADYLDAQRGIRPIASPKRRFAWSRMSPDRLSIVDGHNVDQRTHATTLDAVEKASLRIAELVSGSSPRTRTARRRATASV